MGLFTDYFEMIDTMELEQPPSAPIIRVSGMDVDAEGRVAIGDVSEGNVKLFGSDGKLLKVIGRKGAGPGEFNQPRYPRFGHDRRLHVADAMISRITVFDTLGDHIRTVVLDGFSPIMGFAVLDDASYLVTGSGRGDDVLYHFDADGTFLSGYLDRRQMNPPEQPQHSTWRSMTNFWLAASGHTAYVVQTISDSLWMVDIHTGRVRSIHLRIPGYDAPRVPETLPRDLAGLREWSKTFHIAANISVDDGNVVIPFVKGILNYGDPMILVVVRPGEAELALEGAPPILRARGGVLYALVDPEHSLDEPFPLGRARWLPTN